MGPKQTEWTKIWSKLWICQANLGLHQETSIAVKGWWHTVSVRNPDVRISAVLESVRFPNRPVVWNPDSYVWLSDVRSIHVTMSGFRMSESQSTKRPITGHNWPDFKHFKPKTGSKCLKCLKTGRSKSGHSITGQIYVRFAKPDVRYSARYCIHVRNSERSVDRVDQPNV